MIKLLRKFTKKENRKKAMEEYKLEEDYTPKTKMEQARYDKEYRRMTARLGGFSGNIGMPKIRFRQTKDEDVPEKEIEDRLTRCEKCGKFDTLQVVGREDSEYGEVEDLYCNDCLREMLDETMASFQKVIKT